jgi:hypothetical protein
MESHHAAVDQVGDNEADFAIGARILGNGFDQVP